MCKVDFPFTEDLYTQEQIELLTRIVKDVSDHLASKPKRLKHSISVAQTAEKLACVYDVNPYHAVLAGCLHDWDKLLTVDELKKQANILNIDLEAPLDKVLPLLHGKITALTLPSVYETIPHEVFVAISEHTTGSDTASDLSKVLFLADMIEPLRGTFKDLEELRAMVCEVSLDELYKEGLARTISYLLQKRVYIWPGIIKFYNSYC